MADTKLDYPLNARIQGWHVLLGLSCVIGAVILKLMYPFSTGPSQLVCIGLGIFIAQILSVRDYHHRDPDATP